MIEKIALYKQVVVLENFIEKYKKGTEDIDGLANFTDSVHECYYKWHGDTGATNTEMIKIMGRMRSCRGVILNIYNKEVGLPQTNDKKKHLEKLRNSLLWLQHAIEEIDRWTTEGGHWKE